MKTLKYLIFSTVLVTTYIFATRVDAQSLGSKVDLTASSIPTYPAIVLIDASPSIIQRPSSLNEFAASAIASFRNDNGFPSNYAVELCPFWMTKNTTSTTFYSIFGYDPDANSQNLLSAIKLLSISVATVKDLQNPSLNNISTGIRTTLLRHFRSSDLSNLKTQVDKIATELAIINLGFPPGISPDKIFEEINKSKSLNDLYDSVRYYSNMIPDIYLDVALAYAQTVNTERFSDNHPNRFGIWLNGGFNISLSDVETNAIDMSFLARYIQFNNPATLNLSDTSITADKYGDFGLRIGYGFSKLKLNYEYIVRSRNLLFFDSKNIITQRSCLSLTLRVQDDKELSINLGKNFGDLNNVISQIGFSWLFGHSTVDIPK